MHTDFSTLVFKERRYGISATPCRDQEASSQGEVLPLRKEVMAVLPLHKEAMAVPHLARLPFTTSLVPE